MNKVLFISPNPVWGGAATANISISKMLIDAGVDVIYNDEYYDSDFYEGLQIHHYSIHGRELFSNRKLINLVKELNINTIIWGNIWLFYKYIIAIRTLNKLGINQIALYHSLSLNNSIVGTFFEQVNNYASRLMSHIVYVSKYTQESWEKYSGFRNAHNKSVIIHNPIEYNGSTHLVKDYSKLRIGFVGRFSSEKQPEVFCSLSENPKYEYIAFGDGPLLDKMKANYSRINFKGSCSNTDVIYQNIDILVMTSKFENCPMVVLESKARGIPCVVPNVGGISEIVNNYNDGILYDGYDKDSIIYAIDQIKYQYQNYSNNCVQNAKKLSPQQLSLKWLKII